MILIFTLAAFPAGLLTDSVEGVLTLLVLLLFSLFLNHLDWLPSPSWLWSDLSLLRLKQGQTVFGGWKMRI